MTTDRVFTLDELSGLASDLLVEAGNVRVWCFYGEMGAGKTTLIKALGEHLGVSDPMSSPSFAIVNQYLTADQETIYHFDFYRLKEEMEAQDLGAEDYFYSGDYCFIEWPERIPSLLPDGHLKINIKLVNEFARSVSLELT